MKWRFLFFLCLFFEFAQSQNADDKDQFYVFDKKWKPADVKKGAYFLRVRQISDSDWEWIYYNIYGPRTKVEKYKDAKATVKNGKFTYYFPKGTIDSLGDYLDNDPDGIWYFLNEKGQTIRKKTYSNGILLTDSTFISQKKDTTKKYEIKPGEVESEYPGGQASWAKFLGKNLHYPDRAINNSVQGEVILQFIVDKEGSVINPEINRSVEYSLDEEALRIIGLCGKWTPAVQNEKKVKSYKRQPIIFKLD
jgi:TonB family protein